MPAAAVIPAPIAYIKVVAVKKLVVGSRCRTGGPLCAVSLPDPEPSYRPSLGALHRVSWVTGMFTLNKLECSKQARTARIAQHGIME